MILRIVIGIGLAVACASPGLAQSYTSSYGSGNVIDLAVLEKSTAVMGTAGLSRPPATRVRPTPLKAAAAIRRMRIRR